jgi:hypothetical protein
MPALDERRYGLCVKCQRIFCLDDGIPVLAAPGKPIQEARGTEKHYCLPCFLEREKWPDR